MKIYSDHYYLASEAQDKLGLSKAMFHKKVRQGFIPKTVLPGMKQGLYSRRDIDALAMSMNMIFEQGERITFSRSTPADQVEEMNIGIRCFGRDFITPLSERIAFQQKSEFTFHSLKVDGRVVSYLSMFRFPEEVLHHLLTGRKIEKEITVKEIQPFRRLEPFSIYIDVFAVDPNLSPHLQRLYAGFLIMRFIDAILSLLAQDYQIAHVYAVTTTRASERLVKKLGFQHMEGISLIPHRVPYVYSLDEQGMQRLRLLQSAMNKHLHPLFLVQRAQ